MIPPSSLARLVLGFLEEEGLQRTAEAFQEECDVVVQDPLTQCSSLRSILEEYVEIKESANQTNKDPGMVITSLWKKLDIVVGQLKYHTIPKAKVPRVKPQKTYRRSVCGRLQLAKPVSNPAPSSILDNDNRHPLHNKQVGALASKRNYFANQNVLLNSTTNTGSIPPVQSTASVNQTSPRTGTDSIGVSCVSTVQQQSGNLLSSCNDQETLCTSASSYQQFGNNVRGDSLQSTGSQEISLSTTNMTAQSSSSGSLVCTCSDRYNMPTDTAKPSECSVDPSIEVVEEMSTSPLLSCTNNSSNDRNLSQESHAISEHCNMEDMCNKIEVLSKSPKRKGHPPRKRNFVNPSPSKSFPLDTNPDSVQPLENNFDLQQLFDGSNLDPDATVPLLLDTFLSTPLLQEKLAENINKVVGSSTKQNEVETEVVSESSQATSSDDNTALSHHNEPQVPVDDILNLMEADPAFNDLFNLLSTEGVKMVSPAKGTQAVSTCANSTGTTSDACSSSGPVSTVNGPSAVHSSSSESYLPATSVVTESLLLLASSPSKFPSSTSTTPSLESLQVISPKEVTPESAHKQHKDKPMASTSCENSVSSLVSTGQIHVRSLQFYDKEPVVPLERPKKSKPSRKKRNSNKVGTKRLKHLNSENKDSQVGELQRSLAESVPGAAAEGPGTFSTLDLSAVKLLQSFASLHSNGNGSNSNNNGNGTGLKKSQGGNLVQLLQDAAINQQLQGASTVCESQHKYPKQTTDLSNGSMLKNLQPEVQNTTFSSTDHVTGVSVPPRQISSRPFTNQQHRRQLLPRPIVQPQAHSSQLLTALLRAPPKSAYIQALSTSQSSQASAVPLVSSASSASVTLPSLSSSVMLPSSLPLFARSAYALSSSLSTTSSFMSPSPHYDLSSAAATTPTSLPSFAASHERSSSLPSSLSLSVLMPQSSLQPLTSCVSSSSSSSSGNVPPPSLSTSLALHESSLPSSVNQQTKYFSLTQQQLDKTYTSSANTPQSTLYHNPSTNLQTTGKEGNNQRNQIDSPWNNVLGNSPSSDAMAMTKEQQTSVQLDSNEPSPTSKNAEECVSGFLSGFEDILGNDQNRYQDSSTLTNKNILSQPTNSSSQNKDFDNTRMSKRGTCNKGLATSDNNSTGANVDMNSREVNNVDKQEKGTREIQHSDSGVSCTEERRYGQKRPAGQVLKENKPKKSKGCKKSKKSKTKPLPKDFDVEKFLSKLHYVEK